MRSRRHVARPHSNLLKGNPARDDGFSDFAQSVVHYIEEVFFWRDPESLKPHFVSNAFERIWGQSCQSAYADPSSWIESIHPDDRDRVKGEFERAAASGHSQVEYRIVRPDGAERWIWARTFPVQTEQGSVTRLIGIAQDCTERKHAERTQALLASIVESSDDSILGTDLHGVVVSWNHGAEKLFGYASEEVIGKQIRFLFPPGPQAEYLGHIERLRLGERIDRFEAVRLHKDGTPIDVSVILSPIKDSLGQLHGISAIYRDITDRKKADAELVKAKEAAEAASRAKSTFLATMSHEIRTPMNGILGMTEVVLESGLTVDQRDSLELVRISAESLTAVINDILDFSKIEAGKIEFESIPFDLRASLDETLKTLGFRAQQKGLELVCDVRPDVPAGLLGDPGRLRQVLVNLVGNSIKFTEHGQILVSVERESETPEAVCLHFSVRDTGVGIPAEKQEKIFEAFSQADGSMTRKYGGTGLGLTICSRLVEMMGGRIWVESQAALGSTFHFTMFAPVQTVVSEPAIPLHPALLRDLSVLIVDDNSVNRILARRLLEKKGYSVSVVGDGREALAALDHEHFDIVLMDVQMPNMDGIAATAAIRQLEQATRNRVPIVAMTAHALKEDQDRCLAAGMDAYISKPIRQEELYATIEGMLSR